VALGHEARDDEAVAATGVVIRQATHDDLDAIEEIDRHSFPRPWPRATFEAELARDVGRIAVIEDRATVIAFCNYWLVAGEIHILAIATHPDHRRGGIGAKLLAFALDDGRAQHCTVATLEVRRGNTPAIALYERAGFVTVHVRQRYYIDNNEDALVMTCDLTRLRR
jgi:ribosomal-protein-alanine N-acetyltransferase